MSSRQSKSSGFSTTRLTIIDNHNLVYNSNMPATTANLNQVPKLQMTAQSLQDFSMLPFQVAYSANPQELFLYSDNGFDSFSTGSMSKEDKALVATGRGPVAAVSRNRHASPPLALITKGLDAAAMSRSRFSPVSDGEANDRVSPPVPLPQSSTASSDNDYDVRPSDLRVSRGKEGRCSASLMLLSVPQPAFTEAESERSRRDRAERELAPVKSMSANHAHQALRYPPNGSDALLSATAIGYSDSEILHDGSFESTLGTLDDGLLSGGNIGGASSSTFDNLFEGDGAHDSYMGEGNQDLQLSPHTFGLNDGSNLSSIADSAPDAALGNGSEDGSRDVVNRLSVPSLVDKSKAKPRPNKAASPSRTGSQACPVCSKVFSNSSALAKHKLTHSDERKYVCQLCTKAFKRQDHLNGHLLTHMNKKPYACKVDGCGKSYCDARSLRRHTENHHASSSAVAATTAAVNAIAVRMANHAALNLTNAAVTYAAEGKAAGQGNFLGSALQSNRICYAPPPSAAAAPQPPPPQPSSSASQLVTSGSSMLQSVLTSSPVPSYRGSPSPSALNMAVSTVTSTAVETSSSTSSSATSSSSSASGQLKLLAFQQQEHESKHAHQEPRGASGPPEPGTSLLSWQLQQPRVSSGIVYMNSSLGLQQLVSRGQPPAAASMVHDDQGDLQLGKSLSNAMSGSGGAAAVTTAATTTTSVLAQHLRMGIPTQPFSSRALGLGHEMLVSRLSAPAHHTQQQQQLLNAGGGILGRAGTALKILPPSAMQQQQPLALDIGRLHDQWMQSSMAAGFASVNGDRAVVPPPPPPPVTRESKPVECSICQRVFKNTPALNGHMRLHGGYFKKDSDGHKKEKKSDGAHHHSSSHPPLQTASMNIRALIEERIIQRRIVNPPVPTMDLIPPEQHLPPVSLTSDPSSSGHMQGLECPPGVLMSQPTSELMSFDVTQMSASLHHSDHTLQEQQMHSHHHHHHGQSMNPLVQLAQQQASPLLHVHHHQQQQQHSEEYIQQPQLPLLDVHPPSPLMPVDAGAFADEAMDTQERDDAQSDMQRQIEIIKQGLMAHQHVSEKFRRHSDSDHFLAPRRLPYDDDDDDGFFSVGALAEFFQRKMAAKRMQRTGSDPGEFIMNHVPDGLLPDDVVASMDVFEADALGHKTDMDEDADDLSGGFQVNVGGLPSSDIMDFEVGNGTDEENLASTLSLHSLARTCETSLLATALSVEQTVPMDVVHPPYAHTFCDARTGSATPPKIKPDEDDDVFVSPLNVPTSPIHGKKKHRPEPLFIPPQVNACGFQSRLRSPRLWDPVTGGKACSPPPYTPPPMLSPVRCGPGLFWHVRSASGSVTPKSAPLTPGRQMGLISSGTFLVESQPVLLETEEEEMDDDAPETDILPHVNIGPQFQARLPLYKPRDSRYNPHVDDLLWSPSCEDSISDKEVETYLQFACCAAVPGGGRNKEYALHVLHLASGNIQEAMMRLMDASPKLQRRHPLNGYSYAENDKWSAEEIECYQLALTNYDKDFFNISLELKTKTVKQCIQFYYLWKKVCPDEYKKLRLARRRREQDGLLYNLRSKPDGDGGDSGGDQNGTPKSDDLAASPLGKPGDGAGECFVCDHPDCYARFVSRQALNGHVRIHGGNTSVKIGNGNRSRSPAHDDSSAYSPANPASNNSANSDPVDEFPCKICGKVFFKVKSRSAHMKSHRPIDPFRSK